MSAKNVKMLRAPHESWNKRDSARTRALEMSNTKFSRIGDAAVFSYAFRSTRQYSDRSQGSSTVT